MESVVSNNIECIINRIENIDEVKTNLYVIRALNLILQTQGTKMIWWEEAMLELGKVIDTVRVNKCGQALPVVLSKMDVLLPCADILQAVFYIHRAWSNPQSKEKIKQSVFRAQSGVIESAKAKLHAIKKA